MCMAQHNDAINANILARDHASTNYTHIIMILFVGMVSSLHMD